MRVLTVEAPRWTRLFSRASVLFAFLYIQKYQPFLDDLFRLILKAPASHAFARFHLLAQYTAFAAHKLGPKTRGKDLASQFLRMKLAGSRARGGGMARGASQCHA